MPFRMDEEVQGPRSGTTLRITVRFETNVPLGPPTKQVKKSKRRKSAIPKLLMHKLLPEIKKAIARQNEKEVPTSAFEEATGSKKEATKPKKNPVDGECFKYWHDIAHDNASGREPCIVKIMLKFRENHSFGMYPHMDWKPMFRAVADLMEWKHDESGSYDSDIAVAIIGDKHEPQPLIDFSWTEFSTSSVSDTFGTHHMENYAFAYHTDVPSAIESWWIDRHNLYEGRADKDRFNIDKLDRVEY